MNKPILYGPQGEDLLPKQKSCGTSEITPGGDFGWNVPLSTELYGVNSEYVAWVTACIELKYNALTQLGFYVGDEQKNPVESGVVVDLLNNPNPYFPWTEILTDISAFLDRNGEAFIFVQMNALGTKPLALWPFNPSYIKEILVGGTYFLQGWDYSEPGFARFYLDNELVIWRNFNPKRKYRGRSPLEAATLAIKQDFQAGVYNNAAMSNGGASGGSLSTDQELEDWQLDEMEDRVNRKYAGPGNAGKVWITHAGFKYSNRGWSPKDMMVIDVKDAALREICAALNVPTILVDGKSTSYDNYTQAKKHFWQDTVQPRAKSIADQLTKALCDRFQPGTRIWVDTSGVEELQKNYQTQLQNAEMSMSIGMTLNECIEAYKLPFNQTDYGDVPMINTKFQSWDRAAFMPPASTVSPIGDQKMIDVKPIFKTIGPDAEAVRAALWKDIVAPFDALEKTIEKKIAAWFYELRSSALRRMGKIDPRNKQLGDVPGPSANTDELAEYLLGGITFTLGGLDNQIADYLDLGLTTGVYQIAEEVEPSLAVITRLGLSEGATRQQVAEKILEEIQPSLTQYLADRQLRLKQIHLSLDSPLRKALAQSLGEGFATGEDWQELTTRVRDVFKNENVVNPNRIARTEVHNLMGASRNFAMQEAGVTHQEWLTARDNAVRGDGPWASARRAEDAGEQFNYDMNKADHRELERCQRPFGEPFPNGLLYPGDGSTGDPGEFINCRCVAIAAGSELEG